MRMKQQRGTPRWGLLIGVVLLLGGQRGQAQTPGLRLSLVAQVPTRHVVASYAGADRGQGNTSIAFDATDSFKWSGTTPHPAGSWGYFTAAGEEIPYLQRDRDLGQTFRYTGKTPQTLRAITVATGYGTNVVRAGVYGRAVSIQVFAVSGEPVLHQNGSDSTTEAFHGFPHDRPGDSLAPHRDDYLTGETYTSLAVYTGAVFPDKRDFGFSSNAEAVPPSHPRLKGRLLRFELPPGPPVVLQPGQRYAFLVMLDEQGTDCGFTLANNYYGTYPDGHGIRRDGNGVFPPVRADPSKPFTDPANAAAHASAHFPADFARRTAIPPGTNGYPDVCTWRDLTFYIEAR
jgi:hypothetical protein